MKTLTLDARGLLCPLPVLKARKILLQEAGAVLLAVQVSDGASEKDFRLFCDEAGFDWVGALPTTDGIIFNIKKSI